MQKLTVIFAIFLLVAGLGVGVLLIRYPQTLKPGAQEEIVSLSYQPHPNGDVIAGGVSQDPQTAIAQMVNASRQDPNILSLYLSEFGGQEVLAAALIDDAVRAQAADQLEEILTNSLVNLVQIEEDTVTYLAMDAGGNTYETTVPTSSLENPTQLVFTPTAGISATATADSVAIVNDCGNIRKVGCNERCHYTAGGWTYQCIDSLTCYQANSLSYCRNPNCPEETNCICPTPTPTPTATPTPTGTPIPTPTPTATPTPTTCPLPEIIEGVEIICP
ncbi:MAG: hypothetical protein FJ044_00140 [Candidatus Cloacimonetes bacterium]|nr:hypothetical protein [Candidatus Cloacimonadota bacterium]